MYPWLDRAGRLSPLKLVVFVLTLAPGLLIAGQWWAGALEPKPVGAAIRETGEWAVRFLLLSLAVTPLRRIGNWPRLILVRRMLGVAVAAYVTIHLALYVVDLRYDLAKVASEIVLRIYLAIGFAALLGVVALGTTSTDAAIRRMGATRWNRLHKTVYAIGVLALVHDFMQSKLDVSQPALMAGLFILLMAYRIVHRFGAPSTPLSLLLGAVAAALLTGATEAAWYALATGVPPERVLWANLAIDVAIRPMWWVLAVGLCAAVVNVLRVGVADPRPGARLGRREVLDASAAS